MPLPAGSRLRASALGGLIDPWTTWVPTLTNLTLGSGGVVTARYRQVGKTVDYRFKFKLGAGSAVGSNPRFTLPVAPHGGYGPTGEDRLGTALLLDAGVNIYDGIVWFVSGSTVEIGALNAAVASVTKADITATVPFTWGSGDTLNANGTYEAL